MNSKIILLLFAAILFVSIVEIQAKITIQNRRAVVDQMNAFRSKVARGKVKNGNSGKRLKKASNMLRLTYAMRLEKKAKKFVKSCNITQVAGVNLYSGPKRMKVANALKRAVNAWIREIKNTTMKALLLSFLLLLNIAATVAVTENQVECKSLTAYFVGVFKNRFRPRYFYDLQFELKLNAVDSEKEIYLKAIHWNESLSASSDFDMDFYYDDGWKDPLCSDVKQGCSGPYSTRNSDFTLDLNAETAHDSFHLLYFKQFANSFVLDNPVGQCTSNQMSLDDVYTPDATSFKYCVCCGSYSPDLFLGCPENPWAQSGDVTTQLPSTVTTDGPTPPTQGYVPCAKQIVIAIDNSKINSYVPQMKQLLVNQVFGDNWNHTERLGLVWYSNSLENYIPFDYFNDNINGLSAVRDSIDSVNPSNKATTPSLGTALQSILNKYHKNHMYAEISSIVFTSQKIKQSIVDSVKDLANKLNSNGHRLAIVGLGEKVDPEDRFIKQLTSHYTVWIDPADVPILPNWEQFFWTEGYGCDGIPPSEPATTLKPPSTPCGGHLLLMLDTSSAMSDSVFSNQITFVGGQLFSRSTTFFSDYSRLAFGQCSMASKVERSFDGGLTVPADVTQYVNGLQKFGNNAQLDSCLEAIINEQINNGYTDTVTVAIHVSYLDSARKQSAIDNANFLRAQNIRLVLIAHGGSVSINDLTDIAEPDGLVLSWSASNSAPPQPAEWLKTLLGYTLTYTAPAVNTTSYNDFTQMVWAKTKLFGCGIGYCSNMTGKNDTDTFVVCKYKGIGNNEGAKIYKKGKPVSKCPKKTHKAPTKGYCKQNRKTKAGEQPESMSFNWKTETGVENRGDVLCKESMNNKSVLSDYMYKGYRTFHFGDSANGVFIYPGCTGFTKNELDHSMRPFVLPFNGNRKYYDQELFDNVIKWQCKEHHEYVLGTLSKFMDLYRGQPKFSLNWLTYLNHDEMDDTFHADPFFRDWFNRNQKKFSNSFVFFMGDHGHNLDGILRSIIGKIENKNPFFSVILPEKLRSNKNLREQLKRNAEQLITHYDVYATFQEILLESYKWTEKTHFTDTPVYIHPTKKLLGSSLFHSSKAAKKLLLQPKRYSLINFKMQRFIAISALFFIVAISSTQAIKCYRCSDEKSCQNPEQVECSADLGCEKLTSNTPATYSKGCFKAIGAALVDKNQCKQAKIGDVEGNYCRCNDNLCNGAISIRTSLGVLGLAFLSLLATRV
ncbi:Protein of unknown function DUF229 domain containing protein [Aphelenchoides bicaudatus]|nr:Protein of unknown function DUF229 domain containing protein [Aphelenchoides bicaudatus]